MDTTDTFNIGPDLGGAVVVSGGALTYVATPLLRRCLRSCSTAVTRREIRCFTPVIPLLQKSSWLQAVGDENVVISLKPSPNPDPNPRS